MQCPLCELDADDADLIQSPYWQEQSLALAHSMNPHWNESEGCCTLCFNKIMDTVETAWVPTHDYPIRGLKDGYRYVLTKRETGNWKHINLTFNDGGRRKSLMGLRTRQLNKGFRSGLFLMLRRMFWRRVGLRIESATSVLSA